MGTVEARIEHVTVYARGARVRRVTKGDATTTAIRIDNLPIGVIDDTVRVELEGPAIATAVRAGVDAPPVESADAEDPAEVAEARRRVAVAATEIERLQHALEQSQTMQVVAEDPTDDPPAAWPAIVAARRALVAMKAERIAAVLDHLRAAEREREEAQRALTATLDRDRRAGTARDPKLHELRKYVDVELARSADGEVTVRIEYLVAAARWTPSYVAKLDGTETRVELRANVAQATGEDWTNVPLALSTAEPTRFAALPELLPQRIGRRQEEPKPRGFRAPPVGAAELYADYQRERSHDVVQAVPEAPPPPVTDVPLGGVQPDAWDADDLQDQKSLRRERADDRPFLERAKGRSAVPPPPSVSYAMAAPVAMSMPTPKPAAAPMRKRAEEEAAAGEALEGGDSDHRAAPTVHRLDYASLRMAPPTSAQRGQLIAAPPDQVASTVARQVAEATTRISSLPLPPGCRADWAHTYDYAFATDGAVDVKADGAWHSIAVTSRSGSAKVSHVAVPREQADVFRVASIANPLSGPLLPGPIDVYDRGRFLVTSTVDFTPPAGTVEIGLGVDAAVKIARNTEFREEATGMLRGGLRLVHGITIDVENLSGRAIDLDIRERVPVTRDGDDDVEVTLGRVEPPWERWTPDPEAPAHARLRGGHRWRLALPAGQKQKLRVAYEVKIASKHELVGGNRREL